MPETALPIADALRDQYDVERELGRGGMATVYLAQDRKHGRSVAIKVLDQALTPGADRFLREIQIIARLSHPHVVPLFDSGQAGAFLYYVMPYIAGESLRARLRRETRLAPDEAIRLARQVADALDYAHGEGVIHRDIKPENILLSRGHALVADFGIARAVSAATDATRGDTLTQIGVAIGTPCYMSPEQAMAEREIGPQTDIYSLACVLFEMIGGQPPFVGATPAAVVAKRLSGPAPSLARTTSGVTPTTDAALARALASEPAARFSTAAEFAAALGSSAGALSTPGTSAARASVAVLPFAALSAGTDDDYFSDGVTEDIITRLGKIKSLKVISRNSVMRFKGSAQGTREIANALGVQTLLQGTVRCAGDRLRVTAQLIDAATDEHLWADSYDRRLTDVFEVQADVAEAIADALTSQLSSAERQRLRQSPLMDVETYNLCLLGRHHWHRWTEPGFQRSIEYYKQAVERSPDSAMAHAGLGIGYATLGLGYWSVHGPDYHPIAKQELQRAVELDSEYPDAQAWLGYLDRQYEFRWDRAEERCRRALYSNPNSATLHDVLANVLTATGRHAEALASCTRACDLDPLSYFLLANAALAMYRARDYPASLDFSERGIALDPNLPMLHGLIALPLLQLGRVEEAVEKMDHALQLNFTAVEPFKVALLVAAGRDDEAHALLRKLEERRRREHLWPFGLGVAYAHVGNKEAAFACLNDAYNERDFWIGWLAVDASLDPLRSDPRFRELLARVNLADVAPPESTRIQSRVTEQSLLVLPFTNMSPDPDTDYFSDGLSEEIIADLSGLHSLRVISRNSAMRLKGTPKDTRTLGKELGVQYVIQGSVRKAGDDIRVTAQLVDADTDAQLWAGKYSGTLDDVFGMQEKLSRTIVDALRVKLTADESAQIARRPIANPRAYEAYLRARFEIYRMTETALTRAEQLLRQALDLIGENDILFAALGETYCEYYNNGIRLDAALLDDAEAFADKALALNPQSSHALYLRGSIADKRRDARAALRWYKKALEHDGDNVAALLSIAYLYGHAGRTDAARPLMQRVLTLDPLSPVNHAMMGFVDFMSGNFAAALPGYRRWYELDPEHPVSTWMYAFMLVHNGRSDEAKVLFDKLPITQPPTIWDRLGMALKHALASDADKVREIITPEVRAAMASRDQFAYHGVRFYALVGMTEDSLRCLADAMNLGFINYPFIARFDPFIENVRGHPEFQKLLLEVKARWEAFDS